MAETPKQKPFPSEMSRFGSCCFYFLMLWAAAFMMLFLIYSASCTINAIREVRL